MTNKDTVLELKRQGKTNAEIAQSTGISVNTVKSYVHRNKPQEPADMYSSDKCRNCGKLLSVSKTKPKIFCCDHCRYTWWSSHPAQRRQAAMYDLICANCGKAFASYGNRHRKYCSHACYIAARFGKEPYHEQ